jgi:hypothetical protein
MFQVFIEGHLSMTRPQSSLYTGVTIAALLGTDSHMQEDFAEKSACILAKLYDAFTTGDRTPIPNNPFKPDGWWLAANYLFRFTVFGYCTVTVMALLVKLWIMVYIETATGNTPKEWSRIRQKSHEELERWHFIRLIRFTESALLLTALTMVFAGVASIIAVKIRWQLSVLAMPVLPIVLFLFPLLLHGGLTESFPYRISPFRRMPTTRVAKRQEVEPKDVEKRALSWLLESTCSETTMRAVIEWFSLPNNVESNIFHVSLHTVALCTPLQLARVADLLVDLVDKPGNLPVEVQEVLISVSDDPEGAAYVLAATLNRLILVPTMKQFPLPVRAHLIVHFIRH